MVDCLFVYRCIDYPWDLEPQPSQASIYREISYMGSRYPLWGWANDYQLPLLTSFAGVLLWFSWTIYAFNFKFSLFKFLYNFFNKFIISFHIA